MKDTILVAVSDSPAAFTAAEVAIEEAKRRGARLRAVTVLPEGGPDTRLKEYDARAPRREADADFVLKHVAALGEADGVTVTGIRRRGRVAAEILAEARAADAVLIVMARVDRPGHAIPSIGSHTMRVLEFATVPVLVVPSR